MQIADIPAVVAVEKASYSMTWPRKAYDYELTKNQLAHYFVLRSSLEGPPAGEERLTFPVGGPDKSLIGLGGFWLMLEYIHINTIAVHPHWRGLGLGEWLLITLMEEGQRLGGEFATLEVRPSNRVALALYQKYRFQEMGRRPKYYSDNGEDALVMTTPRLMTGDYQAMVARNKMAFFRRWAG